MADNRARDTTSDDVHDKLRAELRDLQQRREQYATELGRSDATSDFGDQGEELQRSDELAAIDDQITEVEDRLARASESDETLPAGTTTTVRFPDSTEQEVRIVDAPEQIVDGDDSAVTADSPIGAALAGSGEGDRIEYDTPNGTRTAEVLSVSEPPEQS